MSLSVSEIAEIKKSHKESAREILEGLGVDVKNPLEFQTDMAWVRMARKFSQSMVTKVAATVLFFGVIGDAVHNFFKGQ